jgi:hypothetical protein
MQKGDGIHNRNIIMGKVEMDNEEHQEKRKGEKKSDVENHNRERESKTQMMMVVWKKFSLLGGRRYCTSNE